MLLLKPDTCLDIKNMPAMVRVPDQNGTIARDRSHHEVTLFVVASLSCKRLPFVVLKEWYLLDASQLKSLNFVDFERCTDYLRGPALFSVLHHCVNILTVGKE